MNNFHCRISKVKYKNGFTVYKPKFRQKKDNDLIDYVNDISQNLDIKGYAIVGWTNSQHFYNWQIYDETSPYELPVKFSELLRMSVYESSRDD